MKKYRRTMAVVICLVAISSKLFAGEIDMLVQELVKEGVIKPGKAQQIMTLTKEEMRRKIAKGDEETLPSWIQKMNLKGDLRLRSQWQDKEGKEPRVRQRIRFRLKGEAKVSLGFTVGFGLCTGGDDPRSTNQTLDNMFQTPAINLDYAYLKYTAPKLVTAIGGKIPNKMVIWKPADLLWDGDINVEGGAVLIHKDALFLNSGVLVLDNEKYDSDPLMYIAQAGVKKNMAGNVNIKLAGTLYGFEHIKGNGAQSTHSAGTNSTDVGGNRTYDYDSIGAGIDLNIKKTFVPSLSIFGEFIANPDPDKDNQGYLAGVKFGDRKVAGRGNWQIKYMYRMLEKDAWYDGFPDSDAYGGDTGSTGSEAVIKYGLAKNIILGLDYYMIEDIEDKKVQNLFQFDVVAKF